MSKFKKLLRFRVYRYDVRLKWDGKDTLCYSSVWKEVGEVEAFSPWDAGVKARQKYRSLHKISLQFRVVA